MRNSWLGDSKYTGGYCTLKIRAINQHQKCRYYSCCGSYCTANLLKYVQLCMHCIIAVGSHATFQKWCIPTAALNYMQCRPSPFKQDLFGKNVGLFGSNSANTYHHFFWTKSRALQYDSSPALNMSVCIIRWDRRLIA